MKIIIAPAKKMRQADDSISYKGLPVYLDDTKVLLKWLQGQSYSELKKLWKCNDSIAELNYERLRDMDLYKRLTAAILAYDGIAYQYMAPNVFENSSFSYVEENLRILSGFYGVLKPMDGVVPYRLEMEAKTNVEGKNLYEFWGRKLYDEVIDDSRIIVNLASKEYSRCIEKYLEPEDRFITVIFGNMENGRIIQKGVYVKMARGQMVRLMADKNVRDPNELKKIDVLGYRYNGNVSDEETYCFVK
ncbi:MAG: peroxide stress protein YaaA [Lachnospiraceae bacterium]|nr:peroxide stress protein YaaA [Lachnospiraceae bacterium]